MRSNKDTKPQTDRPQNTSCPAGGTKQARSAHRQPATCAARCDQWGVIVTPPSRNTSQGELPHYTVVHRGFDTLALAIKQTLPIKLYDYLAQEKEVAETERRDVLLNYNGLQFLLKPHGGSGYLFILSDSNASATWAFKRPNAKDPWGIRVSIGSQFLAVSGLGAARDYIDRVLDRLGIRYVDTDISLSRIDYCVDILAPDFALHPANFVMHSSTGRRDYITAEDVAVHGKSGRVSSVTVGGIKGRQAIIYDKRAEIVAKDKHYWWDIWSTYVYRETGQEVTPIYRLYRDACSNEAPTYTLQQTEARTDPAQSRIWRVEMRAGKDLLKDRWDIRTWADLFARYGDLIREACEVIRYTEPSSDPNRARWPNHPLWDLAADAMREDLFEMVSGVDPNAIKEVVREEKRAQLVSQFVGLGISIAALDGVTPEHLPDQWKPLGKLIQDTMERAPERYAKQLHEASERYIFIRTPTEKAP